MSRAEFQSLLTSGLSQSELLIVFYLIDMCNEWGFTLETNKSIAEFFDSDISNVSKRVKRLKDLDVIKMVEYNGRSGFMVNPIYCYQGALHLRRFRVRLWGEGKIYTKSKPDRFYGPRLTRDVRPWRSRAIFEDRHGRFIHAKNRPPEKTSDSL